MCWVIKFLNKVFRLKPLELEKSYWKHTGLNRIIISPNKICIYIYMVRNHQDGYPYMNLSLFFVFWKYIETSIFLEKLIGQWIPNRDGRGIARDIKKNYFHYQNLTKIVIKFGQFKKLKCPNFVNYPNFVTIFCRVLKMKIIFLISLATPRPLRSGINWPINFSKKNLQFCLFLTKKWEQSWDNLQSWDISAF